MAKMKDGFYSYLKEKLRKDKKELALSIGGVLSCGFVSASAILLIPAYLIIQYLNLGVENATGPLLYVIIASLSSIGLGLKFGQFAGDLLPHVEEDLDHVLEDKEKVKQYTLKMNNNSKKD